MRRRDFLAGGCACCVGGLVPGLATAQAAWEIPARFARPDAGSDEGGLWSMMDREEVRLRKSPFSLRDPKLQAYVQDIACRLAGEHCLDVRVHLVRTPLFNASMAPNGMMQVWSGLMLRVDNEAQLAAVLGHEIGHYLARHSVERLRDAKSRSAFGMFIGMFGAVGAVGQLGLYAGMFAYSREHESQADSIGVLLMRKAGYDPGEAAKVWENLQLETKARPDGDASRSPFFATHPPAADRQQALAELARASPGGAANEAQWREGVKPFLRDWLHEEVKRGQHEESLALLGRMIARAPALADYRWARGEVYRLRAREGDLDSAVTEYLAAIAGGGEPPDTHRGLGMIYRARRQSPEARTSFQRYLELAPEAPDSALIKSYVEELRT
ncbi:MAG TPA: M48 family metalloprotease [Burkholderiales bacterium]|nr:M48 family metalloprotease [Burkholderiales bacterium]